MKEGLNLSCQGQDEEERRTLADLALHADRSAMRQNNMFHDGETEASSAYFRRSRGVDAIKPLKDPAEVFSSDSCSGIANVESNAAVDLPRAQFDTCSRPRIPDGILDQVAEHPVDGVGIDVDRPGRNLHNMYRLP